MSFAAPYAALSAEALRQRANASCVFWNAAPQLANTLTRRRRRPAKAQSRPSAANSAQVGTDRSLRTPKSHTRGCVAFDTALCAADSIAGAILDQCSTSEVFSRL